ncbi:unnamed protein product [Malus baccata var. baccata]
MDLEAVGDIALHIILSKLRAEDSARAACVSTKLRASASDESLWSLFCARDLHLSQPLDPLGNFAPSFKKIEKQKVGGLDDQVLTIIGSLLGVSISWKFVAENLHMVVVCKFLRKWY